MYFIPIPCHRAGLAGRSGRGALQEPLKEACIFNMYRQELFPYCTEGHEPPPTLAPGIDKSFHLSFLSLSLLSFHIYQGISSALAYDETVSPIYDRSS